MQKCVYASILGDTEDWLCRNGTSSGASLDTSLVPGELDSWSEWGLPTARICLKLRVAEPSRSLGFWGLAYLSIAK